MDDIRQTWKFLEEMMHDEPLIAVIRGHIYIESRLTSILLSEIPKANKLLKRMGFFNKVKAAKTYDLIDKKMETALLAINTLRNEFAHDITMKTLDADDSSALTSTLTAEMLPYYDQNLRNIESTGQTLSDNLQCKAAIGAIYFTLSDIHRNLQY